MGGLSLGGVVSEDESFTLFQTKIIGKLKERTFFVNAMAYNFYVIGEDWGTSVQISRRRVGEVFDYWTADASRTLKDGINQSTTELDHFKNASFIAFWLRRQIPINTTFILRADGEIVDGNPLSSEQEVFFRYGNEICALLIGFQLCLYYELVRKDNDANVVQFKGPRIDYINKLRLRHELVREFGMVLKHKNMSPHGLYLMYKSLFSNLQLKP
jgi:hypothetical protein